MSDINFRTDKDVLYIELCGRIDATNTAETQASIDEIRKNHSDLHTVLDADKLEYISSAGLRLILKIRKEEPELAIINTSPDVYGVFEMTGFTEMITVKKTYPRISVDGCEFIAKGANGAVYRYDDETIVKVYFNRDSLPDIKQERENSKKAFVLGVNTAIPYGIVRIGDGYGSITELLSAKSITKLIRANPDDLTDAVAYFVDAIKNMHSIEVDDGELPDNKKLLKKWAEFDKAYLSEEKAEKLMRLVDSIPDCNILLHGDYHTNNVMVQNGEALMIDLDTLSVGHPVIEFGSMFNAFVGFGELDSSITEDFLGLPYTTTKKFWRLALARYFGTEDNAKLDEIENKAKLIGYVRLLRRYARRDEIENAVSFYQQKLSDVLDKVDSLVF